MIVISRSPCGERGLKFVDPTVPVSRTPSLPLRGAWIEITASGLDDVGLGGRSPCGERGLKLRGDIMSWLGNCRSPCGERGLKWLLS